MVEEGLEHLIRLHCLVILSDLVRAEGDVQPGRGIPEGTLPVPRGEPPCEPALSVPHRDPPSPGQEHGSIGPTSQERLQLLGDVPRQNPGGGAVVLRRAQRDLAVAGQRPAI